MNRKIQIYIEGERLELFSDEQIIINSTIQNVADISSVFTDYSQSFTVPCSDINNEIVEHFYNFDLDGTLDYNIRRYSKIEIDFIPFRTGRIQLEKSVLKQGNEDSYTFTFYGDVRTLKDSIGEDKLSELDLTAYSHNYSGSEVQTRITSSTSYDVRYPLISSSRLWSYGDATATDISTNTGAIAYTELFPALRISNIFESIENKYGVTFSGLFLSDKRFTDCYLYLKNRDSDVFQTQESTIDYTTTTPSNTFFNTTLDTLTYSYRQFLPSGAFASFGSHTYNLIISNVSSSTSIYYIDVYINGAIQNTIQGSGNASYNITSDNNTAGLSKVIKIVIRANQVMTLKAKGTYSVFLSANTGIPYTDVFMAQTGTISLTGTLDLASLMPDMKVFDFIRGVLKDFNMTCYGIDEFTYQIETLEDWYSKGNIIDITEYTDIDSIEILRTKLYKTISFSHEQSQSFLNRKFFDLFGREYGSLQYQYDYDGEDYNINVPFENLLFQKFTGTDLQVGYTLTKEPDYKPYIPKPILLYLYSSKSVSFKFFNGTTNSTISNYLPLGQDIVYNTQDYTLNFGNDISSLLNVNNPNGLFNTYYFNYLSNLYQVKNRFVSVKTYLPISILTKLKLNDRLVIRDHRYIINDMKVNLTSGQVDFVLLRDFRRLRARKPIIVKAPFTIKFPILFPNGVVLVNVNPLSTGIIPSSTNIYAPEIIELHIPAPVNPILIRVTEDGATRVTEDGLIRRTEVGDDDYLIIELTYTYEDGTTEVEEVLIVSQ